MPYHNAEYHKALRSSLSLLVGTFDQIRLLLKAHHLYTAYGVVISLLVAILSPSARHSDPASAESTDLLHDDLTYTTAVLSVGISQQASA